MIAAAAAKKQLSLIALNLWQTGMRSLFRFYLFRSGKTQDEAWASLREELSTRVLPDSEEWEYQQIRAMLYEEYNVTMEDGEAMYKRYPDSTPLIDSLRACLNDVDK